MHLKVLGGVIALLICTSCSMTKSFEQMAQDAQTQSGQGNYQQALAAYQQLINQYGTADNFNAGVYLEAAACAREVGNESLAFEWYDQARLAGKENAPMWAYLAGHYQEIDNLSKEFTALKKLYDSYEQSDEATAKRARFFEVLAETDNFEKAYAQWPLLSAQAKVDVRVLEKQIIVCNALGKTDELCRAADELLKLEPQNKLALMNAARARYTRAETIYQREMKAYSARKTRSQYNKLLKALKGITADFRFARDKFELLYREEPTPKVANYLSNIYLRLDNKGKSAYWKKLANK